MCVCVYWMGNWVGLLIVIDILFRLTKTKHVVHRLKEVLFSTSILITIVDYCFLVFLEIGSRIVFYCWHLLICCDE